MSVINVVSVVTGLADIVPRLIYITTDDILADILVPGYLNQSKQFYGNIYSDLQVALVYTIDNYTVVLQVLISETNTSLGFLPPSPSTGDVIGPSSSTEDALVRWNNTTGTLVKNSNAILSDAGVLTLASWLTINSPTAGSGSVSLMAVDNLENFTVNLQIGGFGQSSDLQITDPINAIAYFLIAAGSAPFVNGNIPEASGTDGLMVDSGIPASSIITGTPSALTVGSDTNIGLTLGGMSSVALLEAVSITPTWSGILAPGRGGSGIGTYTLGDILYASATNVLSKLPGNTTAVKQYLSQTGTGSDSAAPVWSTISGGDVTGAALTEVDDTNVTLSLSGTPLTALLQAVTMTLGWSGQLSGDRGGTGVDNAGLTFTMGGDVAFSGAYTFTGVLTGNTDVTFPLSGLLSTTTGTVTSVGISSSTGFIIGSTPVTSSGTMTVDAPVSLTGRNMLFNGSMQVWQRGNVISVSNAYAYTADRWQCGSSGTVAMTFSQEGGALSGLSLMRAQRNFGTTGTGTISVNQSLTRDMCAGAAGNLIVISVKALRGANFSATSHLLNCIVSSGTGSSDVSVVTTGFPGQTTVIDNTFALTTSEQYFFLNGTLASDVTQLGVTFSYTPTGTAGGNDWFEITDVQLEIAPLPTNYQQISIAEETNRCCAFYQLVGGTSGIGAGTTAVEMALPMPIPMRSTPTVGATATLTVTDSGANYNSSSNVFVVFGGDNNFVLFETGNFTGLTPFGIYLLNGLGASITLDAELY